MPITVSSAFDSGNIDVVDVSDPRDMRVQIRPEPFTPYDKVAHFQWFHFRVSGVKGTPLTLHIVNAGKSSFPEAWPGYQACASYSYNPNSWFRVPTSWDAASGRLTIRHAPERDSVFYSYFAPYPYTRHLELVGGVQSARPDLVEHEVLGHSLQGRDIDVLRFGPPGGGGGGGSPGGRAAKAALWVVARQHPGESMAEWFMEGLLNRLASAFDPGAQALLALATVHAVPNINPDGSVLGHLRTNAKGANLNREWAAPAEDYAPEVACVLRRMQETGCDAFLDVHGDEEVTYNFVDGDEGVPSFSKEAAAQENIFRQALMAVAGADFKPKDFYGITPPGKAEMGIASNAVGERFKCFSMTLELPFKDVDTNPDRFHGWSPERSMQFGRSCVDALLRVVQRIAEVKAAGGAVEAASRPGELEAAQPAKRAKRDEGQAA